MGKFTSQFFLSAFLFIYLIYLFTLLFIHLLLFILIYMFCIYTQNFKYILIKTVTLYYFFSSLLLSTFQVSSLQPLSLPPALKSIVSFSLIIIVTYMLYMCILMIGIYAQVNKHNLLSPILLFVVSGLTILCWITHKEGSPLGEDSFPSLSNY